MLLLLGTILWITIEGANYPSTLLSNLLLGFEPSISGILNSINCPSWLNDMLVFRIIQNISMGNLCNATSYGNIFSIIYPT